MGNCSNRKLTKAEKIGLLASKISSEKNTSSTDFQDSIGAEIRGMVGVEKGNAFIKFIDTIKRD